MSQFSTEDIRSAVAAGILDEARAAALSTHVQQRHGSRTALPAEDEPFEFFSGFSELFVTVGLILLVAGMLSFTNVVGGGVVMPIVGIALCWLMSIYMVRRRRMTLPGVFLCASLGVFVATTLLVFYSDMHPAIVSVAGMGALALYFRQFHLPFAMFALGIFGFLGILSLLADIDRFGDFGVLFWRAEAFDLQSGSALAWASLITGVFAFIGGMYFDMRDPMRVSRYSVTGFWLHLLAAPALVNTIAFSLLSIEGNIGYIYSGLSLVVVALVALIIDRRSFLTAGIGYLAVILLWTLQNNVESNSDLNIVLTLLILGAFITALGVWWINLRAILMRRLPSFPGKNRLPPWHVPEQTSQMEPE